MDKKTEKTAKKSKSAHPITVSPPSANKKQAPGPQEQAGHEARRHLPPAATKKGGQPVLAGHAPPTPAKIAKVYGGNITLYQIAFIGLVALLFYPPFFRGLFFPGEQQWTLIFAAVLFFFTWLWKESRREVSFLTKPVDWLALGLALLYWLAIFWAANQRLAVDGAIKASIYFLVFWLVYQLAKDTRRIDVLINVLYISGVGVALAGLLTAVGLIHIEDGFVGSRIFSTMQYPNTLAIYVGAVSILGFYLWVKAAGPWSFAYAAGNYLLLLVFLATGSRGGYLVYPVAAGLFFLVTPRQYWFRLAACIVIAAVAALAGNYRMLPSIMEGNILHAWLWVGLGAAVAWAGNGVLFLARIMAERLRLSKKALAGLVVAGLLVTGSFAAFAWQDGKLVERILPTQILARIMDIDLEARSSIERIYWTREALEKLRESPVIGFGGGAWEATYRSHQGYFYNTTQVHNDWAQLWLEVGTIGFLLFVGVWLLMFYTGWQNYRRGSPEERLCQAAVLAAAAGIGAHSLIDFNFALASVPILVWALFGITRAQQEIYSPSEKVLPAKNFAGLRPVFLSAAAGLAIFLIIMAGALLIGNSYAKKAVAELNRQNQNNAVAMFEKASAYDRFNAGYLADLGQLYARQGNMEKALKTLERAVNKDPYNWRIMVMKAETLFNHQESQRAVNYMEKARDLAPWISSVWENLAWTYALAGINALSAGDLNTARDFMEKAIAVPGEMDNRAGNLGEIEKRIWEQWAGFSRAPRVQLSAGIGGYFLGQWQEARTRLQAAREHEKTRGDALLWLGLVAEKQGQAEEANQLFLQALEAGSPMAPDLAVIKKLPILK